MVNKFTHGDIVCLEGTKLTWKLSRKDAGRLWAIPRTDSNGGVAIGIGFWFEPPEVNPKLYKVIK